jgi:ketosteroid isomerase-like protein
VNKITPKERKMKKIVALFLLLVSKPALAIDDDQSINNIYKLYLIDTPSTAAIADRYAPGIIHVGGQGTPFIVGKENLIKVAVEPLVEMIKAGQAKVSGRFLILRREIGATLANDVGYFQLTVQTGDNPPVEHFQKFSWVFKKMDGQWKVITDFDATPTSAEAISSASPVHIIE